MQVVTGHIVDLINGVVFDGKITISDGKIISIEPFDRVDDHYIIPGFVDSHIHIESSMLLPSEFARFAVPHGTVACVADPHEIANVLGIEGVDFMICNGCKSPLKFFFGAPSCVPSTPFETSGAVLDARDVDDLLKRSDIWFLGEMMNYPGVIYDDPEVIAKLDSAKRNGKPVDGHSPGLTGKRLEKYVQAGITSDHEASSLDEALEKAALGIDILIREGSAAKNFDDILPVLQKYPGQVMFCSDDKHPDDLISGHIDSLVRRAVAKGYPIMDVLRACSLNPARHYHLDVGLLQCGDDADFLLVDNLKDLRILSVWIKGVKVAQDGKALFPRIVETELPNRFNASPLGLSDIAVVPEGEFMRVIGVDDGQIVTKNLTCVPKIENNRAVSDTGRDILKLVVYNRYEKSIPRVAFISGFGLQSGALASTVAHDSHNIVAVGVDDESVICAVNALIETHGGIAVCDHSGVGLLPLPVAGLMSAEPGDQVALQYHRLNERVSGLGGTLASPFMALSFMALPVIPELKLTDKGLFDGNTFEFTSLWLTS